MNVFNKPAITLFVMSTVLSSQSVQAASWLCPVDGPVEPEIIRVRQLTNPSVQEIQQALESKTRVEVIGEVDASNGQRISIWDNDVQLNFKRASVINWSGNDDFGGFVEIHSDRVELHDLQLQVQHHSGRCRGMVIHGDARDVLINGCEFRNVADGLIADGNWQRLAIVNTRFLECNDWDTNWMDGGYGLFLEDDDSDVDDLWIDNVEITLASGSGQHGIRIAKVQGIRLQDSTIGANEKRSLWAYGVEDMSIRRCVFNTGSVLFNLKTNEWQTDKPTKNVRMWNCTINHNTILEPLSIYCGKGTENFCMKDIDINSSSANQWLMIGWRGEGWRIRWYNGSIKFNGNTMHGTQQCRIDDWNNHELDNSLIGPMEDPRD